MTFAVVCFMTINVTGTLGVTMAVVANNRTKLTIFTTLPSQVSFEEWSEGIVQVMFRCLAPKF